MTEKQYFKEDFCDEYAIKRENTIIAVVDSGSNARKICDELNALHEQIKKMEKEKEDWKTNCLSTINENSMLWNEISILREQGAKPSTAFEEYLDKISTEHTRFWERKLNKAREDKVI